MKLEETENLLSSDALHKSLCVWVFCVCVCVGGGCVCVCVHEGFVCVCVCVCEGCVGGGGVAREANLICTCTCLKKTF